MNCFTVAARAGRDRALMRALEIADLPEIVKLQAEVEAGLPPGFLRAKGEHELRGFLDGTRGLALGVGELGALVGVALLRLPSESHPHGGPPFPLVPAADWPFRACFMGNAIVRADARGRGLQRALFDARLAHAEAAGMRWVCAGVRLENTVSWRNLLARGMAIAGMRSDYGYPLIGLLRSFDPLALQTDACDGTRVEACDAAGHQAALQAGLIGVRLEPQGAVVYERLRGSRQ